MADSLTSSIKVAKIAAEAAAVVLYRSRGGNEPSRYKEDGSLVSQADEDAETVIREVIERTFPGDRVLGEEAGDSGAGDRCWVVDPLDNTACYLRGSPEYAVIIGLLIAGRPVLGLVLTPDDGRIWWAAAGRGAWGPGGQRLRCARITELAQATVSFASLKTWRSLGLAEPLGRVVSEAFHETLHGGFRGMLAVANGTVDLCLDPWGKLWDHAGLVPLLRESGAVCRRLAVSSGQEGFVTGPAVLIDAARDRGLSITDSEWTVSSY